MGNVLLLQKNVLLQGRFYHLLAVSGQIFKSQVSVEGPHLKEMPASESSLFR